ncbi:uncharacterized protein ACIBXB_018621 [Morphnus guianensis]
MRCDNESGSFCPGSPAGKSEQRETGLPYGVGPGPVQEKDRAQALGSSSEAPQNRPFSRLNEPHSLSLRAQDMCSSPDHLGGSLLALLRFINALMISFGKEGEGRTSTEGRALSLVQTAPLAQPGKTADTSYCKPEGLQQVFPAHPYRGIILPI